MTDKVGVNDNVIHFTCQHCQASLIVDISLAGVAGPCPSCGAAITAPKGSTPEAVVVSPRELKKRKTPIEEVASPPTLQEAPSEELHRSSGGGRAVCPRTGLSEAYEEKSEMVAIIKMLIAALVVIGLVMVVAYYLKSEIY